MTRIWIVALSVWLVASFAVVAQDASELIDYPAWENVAERAETAIEADRASVDAFESLRSEIVIWRERFLVGQDVNAARLKTLRAQREALGPVPEDGAEESTEIAARRVDLNEQIAEAQTPALEAEEAYSRADGLANEIDAIIRARQSDVLFRLGPSPLNPVYWAGAAGEFGASLNTVWSEFRAGLSSDVRRETTRNRILGVIAMLIIAVVLIFRAPAWVDRAEIWALRRTRQRTQRLIDFVFSLGDILFPVLGVFIIAQAITFAGITEFRTEILLAALPIATFFFFGARWLGARLYAILATDAARAMHAGVLRRAATYLGLLLAVEVLLAALNQFANFAEQTLAIVFFIPAVLAGVSLFRVGLALTRLAARSDDGETETVQFSSWVRMLGRAVALVAIAGIILAAIGYMNAALYLLFASILSLGLIAVLILLNDVVRTAYAALTRAPEGEEQGLLIPTLLIMALVIVAMPLFALAWGARLADLTELWAQFREGVTLGDTRISPTSFLTFVVVFGALYVATRIVQGALRVNVLPKTRIDAGGQNAIVSGLGYVGIFLAAIIAITSAGIDLSAFALVAGALSVGIGFGLQNIVQNFVSGIILLIERPVAEGDWIEVGGVTGTVRKISVRSTHIESFDRYDIIVPNGEFIAGAVKNWTRGDSIGRIKVPVGVAYGNDTRRVAEILRGIAVEHPLVSMTPEPAVDFLGFGADSMDFQIRVVLRDVNYSLTVRSELNHRIAERFAEEEIEIPFAQRDIWIRNPEALPGGPAVRAENEKPFDSVRNDPSPTD